MKPALAILLALLLAPLAALPAAEPVAVDLTKRTWQGIPGLERTAKGRIFVSWFTGGKHEPQPENTVVLSHSDDGGQTFSAPQAMGLPLDDGTRCYDPCLWIDPKGRLWYLFNRSVKDSARHGVYARICHAPDATPPVWGAEFRVGFDSPFSFRMNKATVLSTGEWVLPVVHALEPLKGWAGFDPKQVFGAAISADEGKTWKLHGAVKTEKAGLENMIVERKDGRLWMLIRTEKVLWESHSADKGRTWTEGKPTRIATPHSRFFIRRLASGNLLLVNHHKFTGRSHLTAQLSTDDGATWNDGLLLDERHGVSYPDGVQDKAGLIWITYDRDRGGAGEILLAKFKEADVVAGKNVSGAVSLRQVVNKLDKPRLAATWTLAGVDDSLNVRGVATSASGASGRSLVLDGASLIELKDSAGLASGAFTLSLWFNPYHLVGGQQMLAGKNRYSRNERQWSLTLEPDGQLKAYLRQNGWSTIACAEPLKAGAWHFVTLVVAADKAALFLNGKPVGEAKLKSPIAATPAPITLGGVWDANHVRQAFTGAVGDCTLHARALTAEEIAASFRPRQELHELPKPKLAAFPLWDESQKLGAAKDLPVLDGVEFHVIKKWDKPADGYTFLHGVALGWHKGRLYASFAHNQGDENTVTEEAQYRVSDDGGKTWSALRAIDSGEQADLAVSHGVFVSHAGKLWAFHGAYYKQMERIHTRAYSLDEATGQWIQHGVVIEHGFWPMNQPVKMTDGNWIMPGISAGPYSETGAFPAAVAISRADDFTKWDFVGIPVHQGIRLWGESSLIVDGANVLNIARYGGKDLALISNSTDLGRTWTTMAESNLPMATSKPAAGVLSNGRRYLVCTTAANNGGRRSPLTIALSEPGQAVFSKVFSIRHDQHLGPGESHEKAALSYPCATEHDGKLYVGFSNNGGRKGNLNSAEMAVIPLRSLEPKP